MTDLHEYRLGRVSICDLPKVSLHDHLDGGLRPQTILELAGDQDVRVPASDPDDLAEWFLSQCNAGNLVDYLQTFQLSTSVMQTGDALARVAEEFVLDLAADGVVYGEVRWAPEQHLTRGLSLDDAVEAVQDGLEAGMSAVREKGRSIQVGQLVTAMRHADRGLDIARLAVRHRDTGVVGFDIAGAEDGFLPSRHRLAFEYLAQNFMPATVHAGEAAGLESIASALFDGRVLRLGHGVRLAEDVTEFDRDDDNSYVAMGELAAWTKDREIALELCPSSNLQTGAVEAWGDEIADHPFDLLYQLGFNVTVSPDNRTQSGTSLTRELSLLAEAFDYDLADLESFQINAAQAAFAPIEDREDLIDAISQGFEDAESYAS